MELLNTNCINVGNFTLKNGKVSKYYYDMKNLISYPILLKEIGDKMYNNFIKNTECDLLCGVPYGGLPICNYISTQYNIPMIMVRNNKKEYGMCKQIEGNYKNTDKCIIIDDVITSGSSVQETIDILQNKVNLIKVVVIFNRQENFICSLPVNFVYCKTDITRALLYKNINEKGRLCFSADIEDPTKLLQTLDKIGKYICICKIHFDTINFTNEITENAFIKKLIDLSIIYNFLIMEDRKFVDISYIVAKQYKKYSNWVDLVTVHGSVVEEVIQKLSGVLIVANMSNNTFNYNKKAIDMAINNPNNVIGFITQKRLLEYNKFICMTPGIKIDSEISMIEDQKYRNQIDKSITDIIIVGRGIYNAENIEEQALIYSKLL